jgi:TBC1 domain family member 20
MLPSLAPTVAQLRLIPDILNAADPKLRRHLASTDPFYALAGTLTMYAHNIQEYGDIARLFDILLAREPVFSVYMFAQIVLGRREELFETPSDDSSMLHFILSKVPDKLDLDALITATIKLFERIPPESLRSWRQISSASSLKTARSIEACAVQTVEEGHKQFEQQCKELAWTERREKLLKTIWYYRRPARAIGLAVMVGIVAIYLRRNPGAVSNITAMISRLRGN